MLIRDNVETSTGEISYPGIRDIYYEDLDDVRKNGFGNFIITTHSSTSKDYFDKVGVTLYKPKHTDGVIYRIYNDVVDYKYTFYEDLKLIEKLRKLQSKVKLTKFPTGIVRIKGYVVGQEVPYFENSETISEFIESKRNKKVPTHYYIEILKIMKELMSVGIVYNDIHSGNFLVDKDTEKVNLIDFEPIAVSFIQNIENYDWNSIIVSLKILIKQLNEYNNIKFDDSFKEVKTMESLEDYINNEHKKLLQK